jgi:thymidylate synthase (FAD)
MELVEQYWEWVVMPPKGILQIMEKAARTCYRSEDKITKASATKLIRSLIKSGHHAMIEFGIDPTIKVITNRGVTHEIVRHRLFSFAQESTRYVNYLEGDMEIIKPVWWDESTRTTKKLFLEAIQGCEYVYKDLIRLGWKPQQAREVLPNALKTAINIKGNIREWRHFFSLRCSKAAHPQMRNIAISILAGFYKQIPVVFDDIAEKFLDAEARML